MYVDLIFSVRGETIPTDHAYPLYAALSRIAPAFHDRESGLRFLPLGGIKDTPGHLRLTEHSRLRIRLPDDRIRLALPLAGKKLDISGRSVRFGVPSVATLVPAATLKAHLATFKHSTTPERFLETARQKLAEHGIEGDPSIPLILTDPRMGQVRRRVVRVKGKAIVGFGLIVCGLSAEHSLRLQELDRRPHADGVRVLFAVEGGEVMDTLWGKYHTTGITLLQHTMDVVAAGDALFGAATQPTRLGGCWLRFFKLPPEAWTQFYWNLLAAELLHDWGKVNDGMQRVLTGKGEQEIRHEHFSAILIGLPSVMAWLKGHPSLEVPLILSAVLTHHLKASGKADGFASASSGKVVRLNDRNGHFAELVRVSGDRLGLPRLEITSIPETWIVGKPPNDIRIHRTTIQDTILAPLKRQSVDDRRMLTAVRAALIAADAAGSGYVRVGDKVKCAVWRQFTDRVIWTGKTIWTEIIDKRISDLNKQFKKRNKPLFDWNDFQKACETLPERALLLAPCGSGKTLAAWRWIAAQVTERPVGRVLFLYPTRATAKEGFRDYVSWAPEADAALMHGNASFDLQGMFDNGDVRSDGSKYEADRRLFSLGYWPRRVFSATVDQFLGFLQYGYGPMCMVPVLADSVIVIDEVHSFDRHMFTALKEFLKNFDVPVLCMTATLPKDRREDLEACGLMVYEEKPGELKTIADEARYTLTRIGTRDQALDPVNEALKAGKRVLWVVNTVRRCHEITAKFAADYDHLFTKDGKPVYCYHSRFKLVDRVSRHNEIVVALKVGRPAALGVTTQVCEMSLDLDVDLLVTEECPVTSLIQRMGRCNRDRVVRPLAESGQILVYKPDPSTPYTPDDLKGLDEFLGKTADKKLCQLDLETTLNGLAELPPWLGDNVISFLASGPYAVGPKEDDEDANTFREGADFNRPCILPNKVEIYLGADEKIRPGFVVPVPKKLARYRDDENEPNHRQLSKYLGVAADGHYHPAIGYCDRPLAEWGAE